MGSRRGVQVQTFSQIVVQVFEIAQLFEQLLRLAAVVGVGAPYTDQSCTRADQISCNLLQQIATV
jgi:hypothetical protein